MPKGIETEPKMLLGLARQYFKAAEAVFEKDPLLRRPLYYLYFHVVELLLKAFLRANGKKPKGNHEITELLRQALALGLAIPTDTEIWGIVNLLTSGNTEHAFRYGTSKTVTTQPDLNWTRNGVAKLVEVVSKFVDPDDSTSKKGTPVSIQITFGKPVRKPKYPT
jgi:hypothetical protein